MNKILGLIPGACFFIYYLLKLDELKLSSILGVLAISIAIGSVVYFFINSPEGMRKQETAFGITGKYIKPVYGTIIPIKVAIIIVASISISCLFGLIFHNYGY